ncbi:hypothetical protein BT96DRAFT_1015505 [Gymnopus androsaceus JB14]|uniref:Cytochrome b-c1 complex subunit 8 n=1 Tax=Gymnopus androsaceus JB14 TaxID=1447944 RepID=A0A6A4I6G7_9AGAR|nr:hypothetical protein BT96DRAFT_1015505 [Gymnopus androsaceus JB14]
MRPSIARASEMPGPQRAWSAWWGDQAVIRHKGITTYSAFSNRILRRFVWLTWFFNFPFPCSASLASLIPFSHLTALSPMQAKAAPNWVRNYIFNFYRRVSGEAVYFLVPFGIGYGVYTWGKNQYAYQNSKAGHIASGAAHH